jgi:beta-lactamase superfamily II metal-dependent hydrolase
MLKITFKNVGQGDSIILEWKEENQTKIGIIDCNLYNDSNPVLNHIIQQKYQVIEFLVLSHPHSDHFSGFLDLINYCKNNQINIGKFYHTCNQVPDFLKTACRSNTSSTELAILFRTIISDTKRNIYDLQVINSFSQIIYLGSQWQMQCLSPSSKEELAFIDNRQNYYDEENDDNHPKINILSTVFKISQIGQSNYILLTADAPKNVLKRLGIKEKSSFEGELLLGQSPHHGAKSNHYNSFWKNRDHQKGAFAIFSVGNNGYGHPDRDTVNFFADEDFALAYTNPIGRLWEIHLQNIRDDLDVFSSTVTDNGTDCIFEIDGGKITRI